MPKGVKLKLKDITHFLKCIDYKLISNEYKNIHTKLKIQCDKGHIYETQFRTIKQGSKCPICLKKSKLLTYDKIKTDIEKEDYILLSETYINCKSKLKIKHKKCGNIFFMTYSNFKYNNQRCPLCAINNMKSILKNDIKIIKNKIESVKGYKLLSETYINNCTKLKIQCDKNHVYKVKWNDFQQGSRCPICNGTHKYSLKEVKNKIESVKGYKLLSETYINNCTKLKIQCDKNHVFKMTLKHFKHGHRCPVCDREKSSSKAEKEIQNYIKTFNLNQINNDRNIILNPNTNHYLELDIYLPELKKAIEYNGKYWHSLPNSIKHDKIKINECKKLGIKLLIVKEDNFNLNKQKELYKIKEFIRK